MFQPGERFLRDGERISIKLLRQSGTRDSPGNRSRHNAACRNPSIERRVNTDASSAVLFVSKRTSCSSLLGILLLSASMLGNWPEPLVLSVILSKTDFHQDRIIQKVLNFDRYL